MPTNTSTSSIHRSRLAYALDIAMKKVGVSYDDPSCIPTMSQHISILSGVSQNELEEDIRSLLDEVGVDYALPSIDMCYESDIDKEADAELINEAISRLDSVLDEIADMQNIDDIRQVAIDAKVIIRELYDYNNDDSE